MSKKIIILTALLTCTSLQAIDFKKACQDNNATACYKYALPLTSGDNAKAQDIMEEGMSYMRKACIMGEKRGCDKMGDQYYQNKNYATSMPYLVDSCARGIRNACESLGTIYRDGYDTNPDDVKSREYYEKACTLKSGDACYAVAIIYRGGFGVPKTRSKEKAFYKKACDSGLEAGCDRYTELDNQDKGIETGILATIKNWFK